jgi:hypothetical protein
MFINFTYNQQVKYSLILFQIMLSAALSAQILDFDLECPIVYPRAYILENNIQSISFVQSGDNIRKEVKKHRNAVTTYYFDSTGLAYMKVLDDKGTYVDTFMMNGMRCQFKTDPDSRFYEPNVYCNDKGMVIANQTEKSNYFYHFDSLDRISSWLQIDKEEEGESNVTLFRYQYDSLSRMDTITEKEGSLRYNLGIRQLDTIYRSTVVRAIKYSGDKMSAVITFTNNNRDQTIAASTYRYKYKNNKLDLIELYIGEDKKPIYALKVLKTELVER